MINLLTSPRTGRTVRAMIATVADGIRSVIAPATLIQDQAPADTEPTTAADPTDVYTADEMPAVVDIERAALQLDLANDNARRAARAQRAARKVLDRLPAGTYGTWIVERITSSRQTADLDKIRAIFKANGLGPVPMKTNAPSLKVRRAAVVPTADETKTLAGVAA